MDKFILKSIAILADLIYAFQKEFLPDKGIEDVIDHLQKALDILKMKEEKYGESPVVSLMRIIKFRDWLLKHWR